jgi:hypothetical protein
MEKLNLFSLSTLQNKLRLRDETNAINIFINLISTRSTIGSGQPVVSLPKNTESVLTQKIYNENEIDSRDDSDSEDDI